AEEAFQTACLRALKSWPQNAPPRDPAAWLIMVGRNVAIDEVRRNRKQEPLPQDEAISDLEDAEEAVAERLDGSHYRDDILRLLFICCHPDLSATQQIALALRIVSGLSVKQIARAFLVSEPTDDRRGLGAERQSHAPPPQRAVSNPGGNRGIACPRRQARKYRLGADRSALWSPRDRAAIAGRDAQPSGRGVQGSRPAGSTRNDRTFGLAASELFSLLRRTRRVSYAARP